MPRISDKERERRAIVADQKRAYEEQESKRAKRIQIDQKYVLYGWMVGAAMSFIASGTLSFNGVTQVATTVGLSADWMRFFMFFVVEFLYLVFLVAYLIKSSRGDKTLGAWLGMWFFAGVGIYANAIHALEHNNWQWTSVDLWTGVVLGVAAPIAVVSLSKLASGILFAKALDAS